MLIDEIRNIKSDKKDLRSFGITIGIVLSIIGGLLWWKEKDYYNIFIIISAAFVLFGLILPVVLKPIQKAWMTLAVILGWFMTRLILSILFYLIFTPMALFSKIVGKKFLDLKMDGNEKSYWINREPGTPDKNTYEKQF